MLVGKLFPLVVFDETGRDDAVTEEEFPVTKVGEDDTVTLVVVGKLFPLVADPVLECE